MITTRNVTDSLGSATLFQVNGREAGYFSQRLDGTWYVYFADAADAPPGVIVDRTLDTSGPSGTVNDISSEHQAIALVYRAYAPQPRHALVLTDSPRSVPAPLTRDGAAHRVALCSTPERVTFYPPALDAPPATSIHTHPRNTQ